MKKDDLLAGDGMSSALPGLEILDVSDNPVKVDPPGMALRDFVEELSQCLGRSLHELYCRNTPLETHEDEYSLEDVFKMLQQSWAKLEIMNDTKF